MNPFDIKRKARAVILSYKASQNLVDFIKNLGIEIVFSMKSAVDPRLEDHPDLQIHPVDDRIFVASPDTFNYYKEMLGEYGVTIIKGGKSLGPDYPDDCSYNIARLNNYYITMANVPDPVLAGELEKRGYQGVCQKQAYAKCMTISFDDFAITCDRSIEKALRQKGLEVYFVSNEGIKLDGFNIGFLGGSCGIIDYKKILFTGDGGLLKDFHILKSILDEKGIDMVYPDGDLVDLGTIIAIV